MSLTPYGIQSEQVHLRVHVCVVAGKVYTYPATGGIRAIASGQFPAKSAYQKRGAFEWLETARGYVIPPLAIPGCRVYQAEDAIRAQDFRRSDNPAVKGQKAVNVVCELIRSGVLCVPVEPVVVTDKERQILGIDVIALSAFNLQVKCDFYGGEHPSATGNLFLQVFESNPYGYN